MKLYTFCWLVFWVFITNITTSHAQSSQDIDSIAYKLMSEAFPIEFLKKPFAITFKQTAVRISKPEDFFTLPSYKIYQGGFIYMDGKKFEVNVAGMKGLCDGKVMVMIDEFSKGIIIDSVRNNKTLIDKFVKGLDVKEALAVQEEFKKKLPKVKLSYKGVKQFHKENYLLVESQTSQNKVEVVSSYYITEKKHELVYWVDAYQGKYDVYQLEALKAPPKGHNYGVKLPQRTISELAGYEIMDMRFIANKKFR